jgi:cardiolipin synthase A/B
MSIVGWVPAWVIVLDWTLRLALAVHVIMRRRSVTTSLAWLVVLVFVPVVGVFIYFLVGESRLGTRRIRRYEKVARELERESGELWRYRCEPTSDARQEWAAIARFGTTSSGFPPMRGNRLSLLQGSEDYLECVCQDIAGAKSHVHLLTYIWQPGGAADRVGGALIAAAGRGVECRVLVDDVGSAAFLRSELCGAMRRAGVRVEAALPVNAFRALFVRIDLRNHRKIVVVDGRIAYAGSQNLTDSTFRSTKLRDTGPWIDASLRIEGPAVRPLALTFLKDWMVDAGEDLKPLERYVDGSEPSGDADCVVQVVPSGPGPTPDAIHQALLTTIYSAREELIMTTPYFVPDEAVRTAMIAAATRGVEVTLVMPSVSDHWLVAAASRAHYIDLLEAGVRIRHYSGGLLHAKTVTVDRKIGLIGSANFDARSFWLNFEITVFIYDDDFASVLRFMQASYLAKSYEVELAAWRARPWWRVFRENTAQLLGPLL